MIDPKPAPGQASSCLLLEHGPSRGAWNMAVDEALLQRAAEQKLAAVRFYRWREPTLSLGYFQPHAERLQSPHLEGVPFVRRLSGGGALLHDRELTYSICLPAHHPLAGDSQQLYQVVHRTIVRALGRLGISASLHGDANVRGSSSAALEPEEPFLCFRRRTDFDVVTSHRQSGEFVKIVGSAQRRRGGAVLQHGAVLLAASSAAPALLGVREAAGSAPEVQPLLAEMRPLLYEALAFQPEPAGSVESSAWIELAEQLAGGKYACDKWSERR